MTTVDDGQRQAFAKWYEARYNEIKPKPPLVRNLIWAFVVGGLICVFAQAVMNQFIAIGMGKKEAIGPTTAVMVFLGAFFTGLGVYDELGRRAGAGSIIPVTGFANSIVAPAMEFKREGYVFGVAAKMFTIAGPVLVYGLATAVAVGLIKWAVR